MARVQGTNLIATRTVPRIETFICNAAISVGDLVFMGPSNKVGVIAAGTNITTANTNANTFGSGIVGIALTATTATDQAIQVQIIDSDSELVLPNSGASTTPSTAGAAPVLYVLIKPSTGTYAGALCVDLATTTNGIANVINKDQDALGMARLTTGTASGVFTTSPALSTPTLPIATGDLVRLSINEANRWYKG